MQRKERRLPRGLLLRRRLRYQRRLLSAPAPSPTPSASNSTDDQMSELKQLGELHDQGVLTDEEFEAQKKKILQEL